MKALWHSPLSASHTVAIAEPLAYLPELNVLVQGPIRQELTLKELIRQSLQLSSSHGSADICDELATYIRKTARGLAELHQCGVQFGEIVAWEDELAEICERRASLAAPLPQLAGLAEDVLGRLQQLAALHPADPLAPAHRSFRPAQVLIAKGEIGFIDFDGFCQAEPALDLALFMTTVKHLGINKASSEEDEEEDEQLGPETRQARLTQAEAICQLFLAEYEKYAPISRTRLLLWETLDLLALVLGSWSKLKLTRLENCLFLLERHLLMNRESLL
jgi:Ser/Thr protein kinase RdoA (MazF antagonist)